MPTTTKKKTMTITAEELCKLLEAAELTQREFAKRLGCHEVSVSRWCTGANKIGPAIAALIRQTLRV